jgi:hypothetical protein
MKPLEIAAPYGKITISLDVIFPSATVKWVSGCTGKTSTESAANSWKVLDLETLPFRVLDLANTPFVSCCKQ